MDLQILAILDHFGIVLILDLQIIFGISVSNYLQDYDKPRSNYLRIYSKPGFEYLQGYSNPGSKFSAGLV